MDLTKLTISELLALSRSILAELKNCGVIRTGNAPAGDYAELLVQRATGGQLAPNSQQSWDVRTPQGERLQVKARVVTNPRSAGERQLSVLRSWDFDAAVVVLFDDEYRVWRATRLPLEAFREHARFVQHVSGYRVIANDQLLDSGEDWTERLRHVVADDKGLLARRPLMNILRASRDWPKARLRDRARPDRVPTPPMTSALDAPVSVAVLHDAGSFPGLLHRPRRRRHHHGLPEPAA
jgi:hypothetical protein